VAHIGNATVDRTGEGFILLTRIISFLGERALAVLRLTDGGADDGFIGSEWRQIAEVDDAMVIERAVRDHRAAQHFDAVEAIDRRRVMHGWINPNAQIDRLAVFHMQDLAATARRRPAHTDATVTAKAVVVDDWRGLAARWSAG